jgi:hypothetical protein
MEPPDINAIEHAADQPPEPEAQTDAEYGEKSSASCPFEAELAVVKPERSAWIDEETLDETSFHWQDVIEDQ